MILGNTDTEQSYLGLDCIQYTYKSSLPCHIILPLPASLKLIQFLDKVMEQTSTLCNLILVTAVQSN
jgi:hypothetical protein